MTQSNSAPAAQVAFKNGKTGEVFFNTDMVGQNKIADIINIAAASFEQARGDRRLVPIEADGDDHTFRADRVAPLAQKALHQRLLIVHGQPDVPVEGLLRRIAAEIAATAPVPANVGLPLSTYALLDPGCSHDELLAILSDEKSPSVIVVEGATRALAGWNLDDLCEHAARCGHYLLLASPTPQGSWRLTRGEHRFWHDENDVRLFDQGELEKLLHAELHQVGQELDPAVLDWADAELETLAAQLQTPLRIRIFALALRDIGPKTSAEALAIARDVSGLSMQAALNRWFHALLDRRGQLIAFALCFFEGLWEETVYHYVSQLLADVWGQNDVGTLDRVDLQPLSSFFAFTRVRPPRSAINGRYVGQRRMIFGEALPGLRRHARQALYALAEVLRSSVSPGSASTAAGFSRDERDELRRAISVAFADIGLIDRPLLDEPLLLLAADGRPGLRERVGMILAGWYAGGPAERNCFYETVRVWRSQPQSKAFVGNLFVGGQVSGSADPADCIDAILALACTYAARGERAGTLSPFLQALLGELAVNPGERTQAALRDVVIPQLIPLHLVPLSDWLRDLTRFESLRPTIVERLAAAASQDALNDQYVAAVLSAWRQEAIHAPPYRADEQPSSADTSLIAMAEVYNALNRASSLPHSATMSTASTLRIVRSLPRHPAVRRAAEGAMLRCGTRDAELWKSLLNGPADSDLDHYVELLRQVHREERGLVQHGDAQMTLDGQHYWVNLDAAPPPTASKQFIERALASDADPRIHQLALRAEMALARDFDAHEQAFIAEQQQLRRAQAVANSPDPAPASAPAPAPTPAQAPAPEPSFYRDVFLPIYVTRDAPHLRDQIAALLPIAATAPATDSATLEFLLHRSWPMGQLASTQEIATRLERAVEYHRMGPLLGIPPTEYPQAAGSLVTALREQGLLGLSITLVVLIVALLIAIIAVLVGAVWPA